MTLKITECYAILINCFWNYDDWTSRMAKIFDNCALSKDTDISLYEYKQDLNGYYFFGAADDKAITGLPTYCTPGYNEFIPIWRPTAIYGSTLITNLLEYIGYASSDEGIGGMLYESA